MQAKLREDVLEKEGAQNWLIPGLKRDPESNRFADSDLVKLLSDAVIEPAGAFGAYGSPSALKVVEILGMYRARLQVCL